MKSCFTLNEHLHVCVELACESNQHALWPRKLRLECEADTQFMALQLLIFAVFEVRLQWLLQPWCKGKVFAIIIEQ